MADPVSIPPDKRLPLAVIGAATLMTIVDETVVSVALPSIQRDLGFADRELSWVVNAYLIAFGGLLLLAGRLGDLVGRRRVLLGGLALFVAASVLCAAAGSPGALVAARFLQGAGGAAAAAVGLGMVAALFDDERQRARAIGVYAFIGACGASIGLSAGGVIADLVSWRWVFLINLPIGLAALGLGRRTLTHEDGVGLRAGADVLGAALVVAGLMLAIFTIVQAEQHGFGGDRTLVCGAVAVVLLVSFAVRQATAARPLVDLRVLRSRVVVVANAVLALLVAAMFGFQFLVALYFQRVLGYGPAEAGLAVLPVAAGIALMSLVVVPRFARDRDPAALLAAGLALTAAGLALLARAPVDGVYLVDCAPSILLFAAGGGLALPAVMTMAMSAATPQDSGLASGIITTSQQVGGAVGLAVLATLAASRASDLTARGEDRAHALVAGYQLAWSVGAVLVVVAFALTCTVLLAPRRARQRCRALAEPA